VVEVVDAIACPAAGPLRKPPNVTRRKLQRESSALFGQWLDDGRRAADFRRTQEAFSSFVIGLIDTPDAAHRYIEALPDAFAACNNAATYEDESKILAYASLHFLERYRRFYKVLENLFRIGRLPMRVHGVRLLDIGAGPAQCLYAAQDFYAQLQAFSKARELPQLSMPAPMLHCVERSRYWARFFHYFSEVSDRKGPYSPQFRAFEDLDLAALRREEDIRASKVRYDDDEDWLFVSSGESFEYHMYIFANFLTTTEQVKATRDTLEKLFRWVKVGQSVLILGSPRPPYPRIYAELEEVAAAVALQHEADLPPPLEFAFDDESALVLKEHHVRVIKHLETLVPNFEVPAAVRRHDFIWDPNAPLPKFPPFAVNLYRRDGKPWRFGDRLGESNREKPSWHRPKVS
jgi:hypothetical protein